MTPKPRAHLLAVWPAAAAVVATRGGPAWIAVHRAALPSPLHHSRLGIHRRSIGRCVQPPEGGQRMPRSRVARWWGCRRGWGWAQGQALRGTSTEHEQAPWALALQQAPSPFERSIERMLRLHGSSVDGGTMLTQSWVTLGPLVPPCAPLVPSCSGRSVRVECPFAPAGAIVGRLTLGPHLPRVRTWHGIRSSDQASAQGR